MWEIARIASLVAATLTVGLTAGLFFGYACSVMPGLRRTDDQTFVTAMRAFNAAILNAWFLVCFVGGLVFTALAALVHAFAGSHAPLPWLVAGLVLYATAVIITGRVNVPLNQRLAESGEPAALREMFEARWVRWHLVRTASITAGFGCLVAAAVAA